MSGILFYNTPRDTLKFLVREFNNRNGQYPSMYIRQLNKKTNEEISDEFAERGVYYWYINLSGNIVFVKGKKYSPIDREGDYFCKPCNKNYNRYTFPTHKRTKKHSANTVIYENNIVDNKCGD